MAEFKSPGPDKEFHDFLEAGQFKVQQCGSCKKFVYYPRLLCKHCGSPDLAWKDASGRGTVYSTTIVRGKESADDYNIALVDLAEGPRLITRVIGVPPDDVKIGMTVEAVIDKLFDEKILLFKPAS